MSHIALLAGKVLTITAGVASTGSVRRLSDPGDSSVYAPTTIAASATVSIGPFIHARNYEITTDAGAPITYAIADSEIAEDSADLAGALDDETGTGAAVFGTSPTIATPSISSPALSGTATGTYTLGGVPTILKSNTSGAIANLTTIGTGDSYTIPANSQMVIYDTFTVNGTVTVNGVLRTLDWPS